MLSRTQLFAAVDAWCRGDAGAADLATLDVSAVADMSFLFSQHGGVSGFNGGSRPHMSSCNPDIGGWDVSSVTDMA